MRLLTIILNGLLLAVLVYIFGTNEGNTEGGWIFVYILFFACPIVSLLYTILTKSDSWFCLYFKRRKLEEQQKIDAINNNNKNEQ